MARCSITISKEGTSAACLRDSNARISTFAPSLYGLRWQYKPRCLLTAALRKPSSSSASEPGSASNLSPSKRAPARLWGLIGPGNARSREVKQEPLVLSATSPSEKQLAASRGGKKTQPSKRPTGSSGPGNDDEEEETFGLFNLSRYNDPWDVPWDGKTVVGGMLLWLGAFVGVGFIGVPYLYKLAGKSVQLSRSCVSL